MRLLFLLLCGFSINVLAQSADAGNAIKPEVKETSGVEKKKSDFFDMNQKRAILPRPQDDAKTEQVLSNLVKESGWFPNIQITVSNGMVTIKGSTKKEEQLHWLAETADRIPSVIAVINQATVDKPPVSDFSPALGELRRLIEKLKKSLPLLGAGLLLAFIFIFFTKRIGRAVSNLWSKKISNPFLLSTVTRLTMIPVWILFFYLVLQVAGLSSIAATIIGGTGALGIVIGFAFKDIAENYISGLILSMRSPFTKGDSIIIDKYQGSVQSLSMRGTTIIDDNGNMILIPNRIVLQSVIQNSSHTPKSRIVFSIEISLGDPLARAQSLILNTLQDLQLVLKDPKPLVVADFITKTSVSVKIMFWFETKNSGLQIKSIAITRITEILKENGFNLLTEIRVFAQTGAASDVPASALADQKPHFEFQGHEKDAIRINQDIKPLHEKADNVLFTK